MFALRVLKSHLGANYVTRFVLEGFACEGLGILAFDGYSLWALPFRNQ